MPVQPWTIVDGVVGTSLRDCLLAATAAPSVHNTQPWLFRPDGDTVDVLVDRARQLPVLDPQGREMLVSVGAAVFNLRLAVRAHGRTCGVRLLPDPAEPDLVARLAIGPEMGVPPAVRDLADAIPNRHTNRRPFSDIAVPPPALDALAGAAAAEDATLVTAEPALRDAVLSLTRTADNRVRTDPRYRAELAAWTTPPGIGRRDGVPRQAFGPRAENAAIPVRDFSLGHGAPAATVQFEPEPTIALLFTADDEPADWVRAGIALQHVLLAGTVRGISATPLTQVLQVPALRELLTDTPTGNVVQSVLRLGYALTPALPTPRRPLDEVLVG